MLFTRGYLSAYLAENLFVCLSVFLSYLSFSVSFSPFIYVCICLFTFLSVRWIIHLHSFCLMCVCLSLSLYALYLLNIFLFIHTLHPTHNIMTSKFLRDLHDHLEPPSWEHDETTYASQRNVEVHFTQSKSIKAVT